MDTQGRGNIDPADQWVFDPETGGYQLRLEPDEPATSRVPTQTGGRRRAQPERPAGGGRRRTSAGDDGSAPVTPAGSGDWPPSRRKSKPKKKALAWAAGTMGFLLVAGGVGGYFLYQRFNGNITAVDTGDVGSEEAVADGPMNILLIGTDSRAGLKGKYGDDSNVGHADTNLLFHVSQDRTNATVLSIPRDIKTTIPDCPTKQEDGTTKDIAGEEDVRFNTSLGQNGRDPGCVMRTATELTGLEIDHFMMADFNAVKDLSTAVGGVEVCLAKDIDDPDSHLKLSAGRHTVKGEQALAFVRTRHSVGFGGDLSRIELQQQFLASMIRQMKSSGTLTSPTKLFSLADVATKALTVDTGIGTVKKLTDLAKNLSAIAPENITFVTVPVIDNPAEKVKATVVLDQTKAPQLFSMVKQDISLTEVKKKASASASASKAAAADKLKGSKAAAADVRVTVLNGSGVFGAAQDTVTWLQNDEGVLRSSNGGNATSAAKTTKLEYAPNQADQARKLADLMGLPASALKEGSEDAADKAPMTLTLGADFTAAGTPITAPTKAPEGIQKVEADDDSVCAR